MAFGSYNIVSSWKGGEYLRGKSTTTGPINGFSATAAIISLDLIQKDLMFRSYGAYFEV